MKKILAVLLTISLGFAGYITYFSKVPVKINNITCYSFNETFGNNWWESVDIGCVGNITFLSPVKYSNCVDSVCFNGTITTTEAIVYPEGIPKSECVFTQEFLTQITCHSKRTYLATGKVLLNQTIISFFEKPENVFPIYETVTLLLITAIIIMLFKLMKKHSHLFR